MVVRTELAVTEALQAEVAEAVAVVLIMMNLGAVTEPEEKLEFIHGRR